MEARAREPAGGLALVGRVVAVRVERWHQRCAQREPEGPFFFRVVSRDSSGRMIGFEEGGKGLTEGAEDDE